MSIPWNHPRVTMAFEQVRDILKDLADDHAYLARAYHRVGADHPTEDVRLVADNLGRRASKTRGTLLAYVREAAPEVLDTWIQYPLTEQVRARIVSLDITSGQPPVALLREALAADEAFLHLYDRLASATSAARVTELFRALARLAHDDDRRIARQWVEIEADRV